MPIRFSFFLSFLVYLPGFLPAADNVAEYAEPAVALAFANPEARRLASGVLIHEVYLHVPEDVRSGKYIVLFNPDDSEFDLSGYSLEFGGNNFAEGIELPRGEKILSGSFYLIAEANVRDINGFAPDLEVSFAAFGEGVEGESIGSRQSLSGGVRLVDNSGGEKTVRDTILWGDPEEISLPGDRSNPADVGEYYAQPAIGWALTRIETGYDSDSGGDWMKVEWLLPVSSASGQDPDYDGLSTLEEIKIGTAPLYPDSDGDGINDGDEIRYGFDPLDPDSAPETLRDESEVNYFVRGGDYNGDGTADIAIFRKSIFRWNVRSLTVAYFGTQTDIPVPGDYNGDGTTDICVYRPSPSRWIVRNLTRYYFGEVDDLPVPRDYNGDGTCDVAAFRPDQSLWALRGIGNFYYGTVDDVPMPEDYNGNGSCDIAVFRPSTSRWMVRNLTRVYYGQGTDMPVAADYDGDRTADIAVFRPATGYWAIRNLAGVYHGQFGDIPAPGEFTGDGANKVTLFRPSNARWYIKNITKVYFGATHDLPLPSYYREADSDSDGLPDWWEREHFGDLDDRPQDNPDGDCCDNLLEYISGTDPDEYDCFTPTPQPTATPSPSITPSASPTASCTPSITPTITPSITPTSTPTPTPDYVEPSFPPSGSSGDSVEYIIITNEELKNAQVYPNFQTLLFHRLSQGMRGAIVTVEDIDEEYDGTRPDGGVDLQTKIRQFIKDAYDNWETDYVLLGGDEYVIPPRYCYTYWNVWDYSPDDPRGFDHMPADIYYGCIYAEEGYCTFDHNANGWYGETNDGPFGGEIDLLYEVVIGRAFLKNSVDLANFVEKTITYENLDDIYLHKILSTTISYGKDRGDMLFFGNGNIAGFHKISFFNKLESAFSSWSGQGSIDKINDSDDYNHMVFDCSHGGVFYGMDIHTKATGGSPNLGALQNTQPFFANVGGCRSGSFDFLVGPGKLLTSFTDFPYGLVIGDFHQPSDGHPDLVASFPNANTVKMGYGNGDGTFQPFQTIASSAHGISGPTWLIKENFNPDEYWDFATVNCGGSSFSVMNSNGVGSYDVATYNLPEAPIHLAAIDCDGDNDTDLAITTTSDFMGIYLFWNNNGNFSRHTDMELPWEEIEETAGYAVSGNFNGDNQADLAVTSDADKVYVLFGEGNGSFSEYTKFPVGSVPRSICAGDLNQDGLDDIVVSCRGSEYVNSSNPSDGYTIGYGYFSVTVLLPIHSVSRHTRNEII